MPKREGVMIRVTGFFINNDDENVKPKYIKAKVVVIGANITWYSEFPFPAHVNNEIHAQIHFAGGDMLNVGEPIDKITKLLTCR